MGIGIPHLADCSLFTPLVDELTPAPDPWEVFQRLARLPRALFLDSALQHAELGRYSFVTADPFGWIWSKGQTVQLGGMLKLIADGEEIPRRVCGQVASAPAPQDPFAVLAKWLSAFPMETVPGLPPFQGGAAGLFGYDLCHHLERLPRSPCDDFAVPDLYVGFYDWVVAFDHEAGRAWIISTGIPNVSHRQQRAQQRLEKVKRYLRAATTPAAPDRASRIPELAPQWPVGRINGLTSNFSKDNYLKSVRRAIEYIHAGDCFQVNLAQRLLYAATAPATEIYRRLRLRNSAPFAGYLDLGEFVVASASPERFLRVEYADGENPDEVEARPIKGTRPRGVTLAEDRARIAELRESAKDRSENIMIVDLLRNDLGRVCRYGSIRVPELCRVETYRYVHHLVSQVRGQLRPGLGPIDLLRAAFPGGSVTGAPKIRAMEIIAELEPTARGPYCGSLGYIGFDGAMDTNILIRTFTIGKGFIQFPVGGGIVADSVPETEYEETWHKAEGMLRALVD
jgi:para-aminobenzoate synthetase component I